MFEFSNMGSPIRKIYSSTLDKYGRIVVKATGKEDFQAYIESFTDQADIEKIVSRALNGEPELLRHGNPQYGDFTKMPKNYAELCQRIIDATNLFNTLDQSVKDVFGNDVNRFIANLDNRDMLIKAGLIVTEVGKAEEIAKGVNEAKESKDES